ncbi:MAG: YwaF family protein [Bacilli bacterium]|nr:YwaF family protein [Bacilli bacterium]
MFGLKHIIVLVVSLALVVVGVIFGRKQKLSNLYKILLVIGIISETIKVVYYILSNEHSVATYKYDPATGNMIEVYFGGYLPKTDLPFHLCSIQIIFIFILNLSKNENLKRLLLSFMLPTCLIGGFMAMVIPTSSSLASWWLTFQYFGYHACIMAFAIILMITKEIEFNIKDYLKAMAMLFATFFVAVYLNSAIADYVHNVNFMYVVNPPVDGLPFLNKDHGWGVYMVHYALLALFALTLCYIKPIINHFRKPKASE